MIKKSWTKIFIGVIVTVLLITGCSNNNSNTSSDNATSTDKPKQTEIAFVAYSNYEAPLLKVVEQYELENPNVKVRLDLSQE